MREKYINDVVVGEERFALIQEARILSLSFEKTEFRTSEIRFGGSVSPATLNANLLRLKVAADTLIEFGELKDRDSAAHYTRRYVLALASGVYLREYLTWDLEHDLWTIPFGLSHRPNSHSPWGFTTWADKKRVHIRVVG